MSKNRDKTLNYAIAAILGAGITAATADVQALSAGEPKYLLAWMSDQYLDGKNQSPLDKVLGYPSGTLPDADFLAVIDANPQSPTYGHVVNTAEMPAVYGQHLLSVTENFVDNALGILGLPNHGVLNGDILGGLPNFNATANKLPAVVPAPSSVLNEAHHHSVVPTLFPDGSVSAFFGGLVSANVFGCDITDPMHIHPAPNSTEENMGLHASAVENVCGLTVSGAVNNAMTGTDDLEWNPVNGHYYTSLMGAGANRGNFDSTGSGVPLSLPPALTTPGGIQELDPLTGAVVGEYAAIPQAPVPGHGQYQNGGDMLGPKRYAPRTQIRFGGVDGNGQCKGAPLCLPGVEPFNQISADTGAVNLDQGVNHAPDAGLLAHPHGIGLRTDLTGNKGDKNGNLIGKTSGGILITSDYADPVSLTLTNMAAFAAESAQNEGTTVRFWDLSQLDQGPYAVSQVPDGPRHETVQILEEPEGLMAARITHLHGHQGMFVASMSGGALFYSADITKINPKFTQIYDFGAGTGASVFTLAENDEFLFIPVSGIQREGDPVYDRDYPTEHNRRVAVLDIRGLLAKGGEFSCNAAPASAWDNTGPLTPLGQKATLGPSGIVYKHLGDKFDGGVFWPNNGADDCPKLVDQVDYSGPGEDGILGTADDHPDNMTSRGGPHFTLPDAGGHYIATANYFVDARKLAIKDVDNLLSALGLTHAWNTGDTGVLLPNSYPPGGPNPGDTPPGGLGAAFQFLDDNNLLPYKTGGVRSTLPGAGSVGDDTICMMRWNPWSANLELDTRFNANDPHSPLGCVDMDFGDSGKDWPNNGARNANAGNSSPHGISFYTAGSRKFFTNGEIGPGTNNP
ncbi:MAG: hypothetical protein ABSB19_16005 [Methylomonas sp.]|jgi:hypothetical protein